MSASRPIRFLPYGCQQIDEEDIAAVVAALRSERITQGPLVEKFEEALCQYTGADHACVVSSGTAACHLAYAAMGLGPEDEIITSPITFAATANAAHYLGAKVKFADVDPLRGNLSVASVARLIGPHTKAIVAVHLGGLPCDMMELRALADLHNLVLIEDAAHALGASYRGMPIGSGIADLTTFSFHPVKHLTTGEGGAIVTNSLRWKERMDRLRHHGIERRPEHLSVKSPGPWYHEIVELGYNYRLTDFQCALGLSQLQRQAQGVSRRRELAAYYQSSLAPFADVLMPQAQSDDRDSAYHLFPVLIDFERLGVSRAQVMDSLHENGIGTQVHYIPVNQQPYYEQCYGKAPIQPGVESYYSRTLSLPMYPALQRDDIDYVVSSLASALHLSSEYHQSTKVAS